MSACRYCGNKVFKNRMYCSDSCRQQYNMKKRGYELVKDIMTDTGATLDTIIVKPAQVEAIPKITMNRILNGSGSMILRFDNSARSPLTILKLKKGDVVQIEITVIKRCEA